MDRIKYTKPNGSIFKPLKIISLTLYLVFVIQTGVYAQINFGSFGPYTIHLSEISMGDFQFDDPVISGGGVYEVTLANSFIMEIKGVKYLDVGVLIIADGELLLEGNPDNSGVAQKSVPFTLEASYANQGQENISDAQLITITTANIGEARFPILSRQFLPPGPPPPPPTEEFDQLEVEDSAYLYLYGTIDVGDVDAGIYTGYITISVQYDNPPSPPPP